MKSLDKAVLEVILILAVILSPCSAAAADSGVRKFNVTLGGTTVLQSVIAFSVENRIPIGVVLSPKASLCIPLRRFTLKNADAPRVFNRMLLRSGYSWSAQ